MLDRIISGTHFAFWTFNAYSLFRRLPSSTSGKKDICLPGAWKRAVGVGPWRVLVQASVGGTQRFLSISISSHKTVRRQHLVWNSVVRSLWKYKKNDEDSTGSVLISVAVVPGSWKQIHVGCPSQALDVPTSSTCDVGCCVLLRVKDLNAWRQDTAWNLTCFATCRKGTVPHSDLSRVD